MSASKSYPRWLHPHQTIEGIKVLVQNSIEEQTYTGIEMKEDGTPRYAVPPTKEMIAERGYSPEAVEKIFAMERDKAAAHEYPYGPNEPSLGPIGDGQKYAAAAEAEKQKQIDEAAAQQTSTDIGTSGDATTNLDQSEPSPPVDHEAVADALGLNG